MGCCWSKEDALLSGLKPSDATPEAGNADQAGDAFR